MSSIKSDIIVSVPSPIKPVYVVYPQRFYVLFVFSFLAFNQCIMWLTFSPIARSAKDYYHISDSTVILLLNWGPIIFIPCLPLTYVLLNKPNGLRKCVLILAIADFIAAALRLVPSILVTTPTSEHTPMILTFFHLGQILNAACGPLVMAPVSQLSCLWFAPHERTRATTIAIFANNFGSTIGFAISPLVVTEASDCPRLLYIHMGLAFVACVLALIYFPAQPPTPPSAAAELITHDPDVVKTHHNWRVFLGDVWKCLINPSFLLLSTTGGLLMGMMGAWTGLYDIILAPEYTEAQAGKDKHVTITSLITSLYLGWFGFGASVAGIVGGVSLSYVADRPRFQHSLKSMIIVSLIACLLCIVWFELSVHTYFYEKPILSSSTLTIGLSTALVGLFAGAASPLIYEALAEIMFPLPESLSASILVQWINIVTLIFLFVAPGRDNLINLLVLVVLVVCILMTLVTRFTYSRRDEDERKRIEKEQAQIIHENGNNHIFKSYGTINHT